MKLTAAKCPSCGADIKVDRNEDYTTCTYCNSNILIEDAVAKYKLEITGKIKVSGIKDNDDRLKDAKNYLKLEEYENANSVLNSIINSEPFNIEAHILSIKTYLKQFDKIYNKNEYKTDNETNNIFWNDVDFILSKYERLQSIDEKKSYKTKLKVEIKILETMQKEKEKLEEDIILCTKIDRIIEEITTYKFIPKISKALNRDYRKVNKLIINYFKNLIGYDILKVPDNTRCMHRDLEIRYYDASSNFKSNKITKYNSLNEIEASLTESKDEIITKIEKTAKMSNPLGLIKNILKK